MSVILNSAVQQHLVALAALTNQHTTKIGDYHSIYEFVLRHGQIYVAVECPKKYRRRAEPQQCFANAKRLASKHKLIYVEGFAAGIIPTHHAWCVKPGALDVIDPTWVSDLGIDYFGVPVALDYVRESYIRSRQYSVLDDWENRWPIFRADEKEWKI